MIIYNTVDDPVTIIIEGTAYHMEPDSELELSLSSGTYSYCMYKTDSNGRPLARGYDIGYRRHFTTVCYAETGLLIHKDPSHRRLRHRGRLYGDAGGADRFGYSAAPSAESIQDPPRPSPQKAPTVIFLHSAERIIPWTFFTL